jgi:hypothetical protein
MGKTFLMKKAVLVNDTQFINQAKQNGRVVSIDCGKVFSELEKFGEDKRLQFFWPMVLLFHIHSLFGGKRVDVKGKSYSFKDLNLEEIVSLLDTSEYSTLEKAYNLLLLLTNEVWKNNTTSTVFLLDEVTRLAKTPSSRLRQYGGGGKHTYLSYLLDKLHNLPHTPLCICAGTADGNLPLVCEGTHVRVIPLPLTTITMEGVLKLGRDYFDLELNQNHDYDFTWPRSIEEMTKDHTLITMIYHTFQVPRLLKVAVLVSSTP